MTSFVPVMWYLTILYSIVVFFFAVIGMEAFHQSKPHQTVIDNYNHYNYNCQTIVVMSGQLQITTKSAQ
jgi:hypothetical protein